MRYNETGVDIYAAETAVGSIVRRIKRTWNLPQTAGTVLMDIGYYANVTKITDTLGLAMCCDGVGSKTIIASMMGRYDTIGIDCIAMNVNDLICVGATPRSFVDYLVVDKADDWVAEQIAIGLAEGATQAGVAIVGGEFSQLPGIVTGFDLAGAAFGTVDLNKINSGKDVEPGDIIVGVASNGLHSNGYSLVRKALNVFQLDRDRIEGLELPLGEELLRPTHIYVKPVVEMLSEEIPLHALMHITGDGFLNLNRVQAEIGFRITDLPPAPPIFQIVQNYGHVTPAEMYRTFNMGIGFCIVVADLATADRVRVILTRHGYQSWVIGEAIADQHRGVRLVQQDLLGRGKSFFACFNL